jgi:mRNA export factor
MWFGDPKPLEGERSGAAAAAHPGNSSAFSADRFSSVGAPFLPWTPTGNFWTPKPAETAETAADLAATRGHGSRPAARFGAGTASAFAEPAGFGGVNAESAGFGGGTASAFDDASAAAARGGTTSVGSAGFGGALWAPAGGGVDKALSAPGAAHATPVTSSIAHAPAETVSALRWAPFCGPGEEWICAASWSGEVRAWRVARGGAAGEFGAARSAALRMVWRHPRPVLAAAWHDAEPWLFSGCCDGQVRMRRLEPTAGGPESMSLGAHTAPVRSLHWNRDAGALLSTSWDKTARAFDPRVQGKAVWTADLGERAHAADCLGWTLAAAAADRVVRVFDLRKGPAPATWLASELKSQITSLLIAPAQRALYYAGIEGRVRVEYLEAPLAAAGAASWGPAGGAASFTFRCHHHGYDSFGVNALAVSAAHDALATVGSDGAWSFWNVDAHRRLRASERLALPLTAGAFNRHGDLWAFAAGYDWSRGLAGARTLAASGVEIHLEPIAPGDLVVARP